MIRRLLQKVSISTVNHASTPLRSHVRAGRQNTFLAVCCEIVLPPRSRFPSRFSSSARSIASQSNPRCERKWLSSVAITARTIGMATFRSGTQFERTRSPSSGRCPARRIALSGVSVTGTHRNNSV